jgi:glutaredoxin 3
MENKNLTLYALKTCPFCNKVRQYMKEHNIEIETKFVEDEKNQEELLKFGGKDQVPMLLIDGKPLYESGDIINWLEENFK